jgi:hypothetical protein
MSQEDKILQSVIGKNKVSYWISIVRPLAQE